ncbi:MAG: hypothetical protein ACI807_000350 [Paracoccaceae bacterium]|jgi:hypothetical protein
MIRYALKCRDGHRFESWFQSGDAFERLKGAGHLSCSVCGSADVEKSIMAPAVSTRGVPASPPPGSAPVRPADAPASETLLSAPSGPAEAALRELRARIEASAENVGDSFATVARAIHDGDADERAIYGRATLDEARALVEDGVDIAALPWTLRRDS